jgi:hypothetical protein
MNCVVKATVFSEIISEAAKAIDLYDRPSAASFSLVRIA